MKSSIFFCLSFAIVLQMFVACSLEAQDSDREDRDYKRRLRDEERREQWRRDFNAEEYLKKQDKNNDGVLAPEEIGGRRTKAFLERLGIPTGKASKVDDLVRGYKSRAAKESEAKRKEFESRLRTLAEFGAERESFGVGQFGTDDKAEGLLSFNESVSGLKASDFEPEILKRAEKIFGSFDRDKSGFLEGDEISRLSWKSPPPEKSDLNRDGRLSKMELAQRFTDDQEATQSKTSNRSRGDSKDREASSQSAFRGRRGGEDSKNRQRDGRRYEKRDTQKPDSNSAVAKAKANAQSAAGYAKYVDRSFKKYDANSDGKLDKKELAASSLLRKAKDSDGDGFISKQEAITLVSGGKVKSPSSATRKPDRSPRSVGRRTLATATAASSSKRQSLTSKDTDGDGQIQMHEYSDTWTAEKLEEFRATDKNGDGLLSSDEWRDRKR